MDKSYGYRRRSPFIPFQGSFICWQFLEPIFKPLISKPLLPFQSSFWTPDASRSGSYKITLVIIIYFFIYYQWSIFLKNGSNNFHETCLECRTNQFWAPRENRMSKSFSVLEIIIHKVQILAQIAKSGV